MEPATEHCQSPTLTPSVVDETACVKRWASFHYILCMVLNVILHMLLLEPKYWS